MNRLFVIAGFLSALSGCAIDRNTHFTAQVPIELGNSLASDAIKQLQIDYPPAQTTFNIDQPAPANDSFGTALLFNLRATGYAVQEVSSAPTAGAVNGLSLNYTVDKPASRWFSGLYRVQLRIGKTILTRAYMVSHNTAQSAGAWAKME